MLATGSSLTRTRSSTSSLRDRQSLALKQMLHFGEPVTKKETVFEPEWKVLIYDETGKNIISPLLSVKQLHESGVTLYMALNSERDEISDTPAIYLVEPSFKNIQKISSDLKSNMYQDYYFNFTSPIARPELEALAQAAVTSGTTSNIKKIFDQHMNFISLESDLFALMHLKLDKPDFSMNSNSSFYKFNNNKMQDPGPYISAVCAGLYAIFATLGSMPIIRATKGHMADEIAKVLDKKFRDSLRDGRAGMFMDNGLGFHRPLLIMLDRNVDHSAPLMHSMHYQSLCHDLLDFNLNYITLREKIETPNQTNQDQKIKYKTKTIDCSKDNFWQEYKTFDFFKVAQAVQDKVNSWATEMEKIQKMKTEMGLEESNLLNLSAGNIDMEHSNKVLGKAVASVPEKLKEKESLDYNMSIATAIASKIKERNLDKFNELETSLNIKNESPLQVITDVQNSEDDNIRYLLYLILRDIIKLNEIDKYKEQLQAQNQTKYLKAIDYIRKMKQFNQHAQTLNENEASKTSMMFSKFVNTSAFVIQEGMKSLAAGKKVLPVTRLVEQIIDQKDTGSTNVGYWDPKLSNSTTTARSKAPVTDVIVFMVGGGCYTEYLDVVGSKSCIENGRRMIYGCTDMINPENYLCDLQRLGNDE